MAKKTGAVELFTNSIESTFNIKIFIIPLFAFGLGIASTIISLLILIPAIIAGLLMPAVLIPLIALGFLLFFAIIFVASAIIQGFYLKSVDEFLSSKKVSAEKNIRYAFSRWKQLTGIYLIQAIIVAVLILAIMTPFLLIGIMPLIQGGPELMQTLETGTDTEILLALVPAMGTIVITIIALAIISILLSPLMFLWFPTALFGKKSLAESIREGYALGKKKYVRNLGALLLIGIISIIVTGAYVFDKTGFLGLILSLWVELASAILIVKIYREG